LTDITTLPLARKPSIRQPTIKRLARGPTTRVAARSIQRFYA
jgi:hypothetical protein